jgi:uncharacterized iron-regulated protein
MRGFGPLGAFALGLCVTACATPGTGGTHAGIDPAERAPAAAGGGAAGGADVDAPEPGALPDGVRIFTSDGAPATWDAVLGAAREARVVLLGEIHDDVVGHRMRHALLRALSGGAAVEEPGSCAPHVVSLEMLESDVQIVVDEYQAGLITGDHFRRAARPWDNHDQDYEPYLEVARLCDFPVVAANPPRRYVNRVARLGEAGLAELSAEALSTLPPLPVARPSERYRAQWDALMGGAMAGGGGHGAPPAHGGAAPGEDPVLMAQNLWDAGMAWRIAEAARDHPQSRIVHVAGAFHVQHGTGIPEHLARYLPGETSLILVAYPVARGAPFDPDTHAGRGDFVILTDR